MRTIIDLPDAQISRLAELVEQEKISRAELIRRAVSEYLQQHQVDTDDAFGLWKNREIDGLTYQDRIRDEW
ncbi:MAG TPA: CopG family transcriptional regulator [Gammaproteobacteria bacterium]|nr:CopG family transcriptional regulator [Gammaproteobacteria bacterium]